VKNKNEQYSLLIDEIVNKLISTIELSINKNGEDPNEVVSVLMLRLLADYADGISILIKNGTCDPVIPILRSASEVRANLLYLFEGDYTTKSLQFIYFYHKMREEEHLKLKPGTYQNERLINSLKSDDYTSKETLDQVLHAFNPYGLERIREALKGKEFKKFNTYWNNSRQSQKKYWYSLLGGPKSLAELFKHLKLHSQYEVTYHVQSGLVHGLTIFDGNLETIDDKYAQVRSIRKSSKSQEFSLEIINICTSILHQYYKKKIPTDLYQTAAWLYTYNQKLHTIMKDLL